MRAKILAIGMVALLVAAAFFLPEMLLAWGDSLSLNVLQMDAQDEEREGFAESIQLSVAEKILLLRSGTLTGMDLEQVRVKRWAGGEAGEQSEVVLFYSESGEELEVSPELQAVTVEEIARYNEETSQLWESRMLSAGAEIRTLQTMGGLPELWKTGSEPPAYSGYGDLLYLDTDTYMSFQVYQLTLYWESYSIDLLMDAQSGHILSFLLQWTPGSPPNWGLRSASGFGGAWRDYWKMDSVSTGWYNEAARSILENADAQAVMTGDYADRDQITFMYDSQSLSVPLECQGYRSRSVSLVWNR